ncbi:16283_t:CDS:2 [Acaulospora colombiana]|uniref:16283_t:CDS:1 n=1 Tax=Acaulospora colombiana TaxID=27376 RepID=A0ACA9JWB3_9GLOM|nr:16283_t:CDS:2 [Acaulospora colombiana]
MGIQWLAKKMYNKYDLWNKTVTKTKLLNVLNLDNNNSMSGMKWIKD